MATLFNSQTRKPESLPEDQIEQALLSGTHGYQVTDRINVKKRDGKTVSIPGSELNEALQSGEYSLELPTQTAVREYVDENKGIGGQLKTAVMQFADEALMGVPELIADKSQDPLEIAKRQALKKENSIANTLGGVGGFGASLLYGGPVGKMATVSMRAGEAAVAGRLAAAGAQAGTQSAAKELAKKIARSSAQMGVEGVTFAAPTAITEAALGDPELAAETLLVNGLAGGAFGAVGKTGKELLNLGKKTASGIVPKLLPDVPTGPSAAQAAADVPLTGPPLNPLIEPTKKEMQQSILERLTSRKSNAKEIEDAYKELGLEALEGSVSSSKFIQDLDSALSKKVSPAGMARQEKWQKVFDTTDQTFKEALENSAPADAISAGDQIRKTLGIEVSEKYKPFQKLYDDIRQMSDTIAIPDEARLKFDQKAFNYGDKNKGFQKEIKEYTDRIIAEDTASGVEGVIRALKDDVSKAYRNAEYNRAEALRGFKEKAEEFLESEIVKQAKRIELEGLPEAQALAKQFLAQKELVNKEYSGFKEFMGVLGDVSKVRSKGTKDFLDALEDNIALSSEKLVNKLFDKNNSRALEWLKRESPNSFNVLVGFKKNEILQRSIRDDRVQMGALLRNLDGLSPQIKNLMFSPEQLKKLKAAETVIRSIPKDVNPSGTARAIELNDLMSPTKVIFGGLQDKASEAILKASQNKNAGLFLVESSMAKVAKKLDELPERLDGMMKGKRFSDVAKTTSVGAIQRLIENAENGMSRVAAFEKLREDLSEIEANPALPMDRSAKLTEGLTNGGAPETASQLTMKNALVAKYLSDHIPKPIRINTPFKQVKWTPGDQELSRFERRVHAIQNPLSVIDDLVDGSLTPETIDAVKVVYPKLFENIQGRVMKYFMDNPQTVSYNNRIKLSLLLDMPLDDALKPENIRSLQSNFQEVDEAAAAQQGGTKPFNVPDMQTNVQSVAMS
jgi:hypothetical protein